MKSYQSLSTKELYNILNNDKDTMVGIKKELEYRKADPDRLPNIVTEIDDIIATIKEELINTAEGKYKTHVIETDTIRIRVTRTLAGNNIPAPYINLSVRDKSVRGYAGKYYIGERLIDTSLENHDTQEFVSSRIVYGLKRHGLTDLKELQDYTRGEIANLDNIGKSMMDEIDMIMRELNIIFKKVKK